MIVALTGGCDNSGRAHLANSLAALRSLAGRNVLFARRSHTPAAGLKGEWTVVDVKSRAVSHQIADTSFQSELEDVGFRYNDVVVDLADDDSAGSQAVLKKAEVVVLFSQSAAIDLKCRLKFQERLGAAAGANPALRVLLVVADVQIGFFAHELGTVLDFPTGIPNMNVRSVLVSDLFDAQRAVITAPDISEYATAQECVRPEMRNVYCAVFQRGNNARAVNV
jgi:chromosome partitioning protein